MAKADEKLPEMRYDKLLTFYDESLKNGKNVPYATSALREEMVRRLEEHYSTSHPVDEARLMFTS